jgi:hypothetical protein
MWSVEARLYRHHRTADPSFRSCDAQGRTSQRTGQEMPQRHRTEMPPHWHERPRQDIRQRDERNDWETALTSGEEEDAQWGYQEEPRYKDCKVDSSCVSHRTTGTGGLATVEVSAPADAEDVVP